MDGGSLWQISPGTGRMGEAVIRITTRLSGRIVLMPGAFMTCTGMCGSGAARLACRGMVPIPEVLGRVRTVLYCVAAVIITLPWTVAPISAINTTITSLASIATPSASASAAPQNHANEVMSNRTSGIEG